MKIKYAHVSSGTKYFEDGRIVDFDHEIAVVEEVIHQSRQILQFEGRDTISELDRHI